MVTIAPFPQNVYDTSMNVQREDSVQNSWHTFLNAAIYLAIGTVLCSFLAFTFQAGYYEYFSISPSLAGINVDQLTMTYGTMIAIGAVVVAGIVWFGVWGNAKIRQRWPGRWRFAIDIVTIMGFVFTLAVTIFGDERYSLFGINTQMFWGVYAALYSVLVVLTVRFQFTVMKGLYVGFRDAYMRRCESLSKPKFRPKFDQLPVMIFITVLIMIPLLGYLSDNAGKKMAARQTEFVTLKNNSKNDITVVMARSSDGLITKSFSIKEKKFKKEYKIETPENQTYLKRKLNR